VPNLSVQKIFQRPEAVLLALFALIGILPFWIFPRFPVGDNLTHSYNVDLLANLLTSRWPNAGNYFAPRLFPGGNALYYLALLPAALLRFNTVTAEKILFSLNAVLYYLSFAYAVTARQKRLSLVFCVPFFLFSYPFHMGFANFWLSLPPFLLAFGYYQRYSTDWNLRRAMVLFLLGIWMFLAHALVLIVFFLLIVSGLFFQTVSGRRMPYLVEFLAPALIALLLAVFAFSFVTTPIAPQVAGFVAPSLRQQLVTVGRGFLNGAPFSSFSHIETWYGRCFIALCLLLFLSSLGNKNWKSQPAVWCLLASLVFCMFSDRRVGWEGFVLTRVIMLAVLLTVLRQPYWALPGS
jgi:hypothetical protein